MRRYIAAFIGVVILMAGSFVAGMQLQKSLKSTTTTAQAGAGSASGGFGSRFGGRTGGARPTIGTVASINGDSISLTTRAGSTVTVTLSATTQITDSNGNAAPASAIQAGQTLFVAGAADSSGNVTATQVRINPSFGGGGGAAQPGSQSSGSSPSGI